LACSRTGQRYGQQLPDGRPSSRNPVDERIGLFATVDSSRFARLRTARGFLGAWRRFVDSAGDKAEPSSARSVLSPSLLTGCPFPAAHLEVRVHGEELKAAVKKVGIMAKDVEVSPGAGAAGGVP
jgi:hypothetical protein